MSFIIREAKIEDCEQAHKLIGELAEYEKAPQEFTLSLAEFMEDGFGPQPKYGMYVAELEGNAIGIALFYNKYSTWKGSCLYLEDLIVTKKYRGIGAGKALFERVIKEAANQNAGRMEWQVLDWNQPAIDFYLKYNADLDGEWLNGRFTAKQLQALGNESI